MDVSRSSKRWCRFLCLDTARPSGPCMPSYLSLCYFEKDMNINVLIEEASRVDVKFVCPPLTFISL